MRRPALTVGQLRAFLAQVEKTHGKDLDEYPVHIMDLDKADVDEGCNLATHVEIDRFDEDEPSVVSIYKWQEAP